MKHFAPLALGLLFCTAAAAEPTAPAQLLMARGGQPRATAAHGDIFYLSTGRTITAWQQSAGGLVALGDTRTAPLPGGIVALERHGDHLYAAYWAQPRAGVAVYSLADRTRPVLLGTATYSTASSTALNAMQVIGQQLYVFDRYDGIFAADLAQPQNLQFQQISNVTTAYDRIAAVGNRLYVSGLDDFGDPMFGAFDLSAPLSPQWLGYSRLACCDWMNFNVSGNYAFSFGEKLGVFDITDPSHLTLISADMPLAPGWPLLLDGHAWNIGYDQIQVIDLSHPPQPVPAGTFPLAGTGTYPNLAQRAGEHVVLAYESGELLRLDGAQAAAPTLTGTARLPVVSNGQGLAFRGDRLFVVDYGAVSVLDRRSLERLSRQSISLNGQGGGARDITIEGDRAYLLRGDTIGVAAIGSDDSLAPLGFWSAAQITASTVHNGILHAVHYTGAGNYRLAVVDLREPATPVLLADLPTPGVLSLAAQGNRLYTLAEIGLGERELQIMDISIPQSPRLLGRLPACYGSLELDPRRPLVAMNCLGYVQIIDVSNPDQPQERSRITAQYLQNTRMHDKRIYVATAGQLQEWDLADPSQPHLLHERAVSYARPHFGDDARLYLLSDGIQVLQLDRLFANGLER